MPTPNREDTRHTRSRSIEMPQPVCSWDLYLRRCLEMRLLLKLLSSNESSTVCVGAM
jgi:hypothetical protein